MVCLSNPVASRVAKGRPLINLINLDEERITSLLNVESFEEPGFVFMATKKGVVKKTSLDEFKRQWKVGKKAIKLDPDEISRLNFN